MRSAFVNLVVVGTFARVQISLRSATLRVFLWFVRQGERGRKEWETYSFASIRDMYTLVGERERVMHVTDGLCFGVF